MIVHIIIDDKFIDMALREFEVVAKGQNKIIFFGKRHELKFVKNKNVVFLNIFQIKRIICSKKCSAVIFHSLPDYLISILNIIPPQKKKIWLGWGYDYYDRLLSAAYPSGLYLDATKSLMANAPRSKPSQPKLIHRMIQRVKLLTRSFFGINVHNKIELLERIDYFSPVIDLEHQLAAKLNPWFKAKYICWNYGTVEDDLLSNSSELVSHKMGDDILIGNSASFENNHLEIFQVLKNNFEIGDRKIIVPLSYGDKWYKEKIIKEGQRIFSDRFIPLVDFLPKDKYVDLLNRCGYVFMNHLRQQALGNICIMMLKGAKIYLNQMNPLLKWFLDKEAYIENIHSVNNRIQLEPLTELQRKNNINIILRLWGRDAQRARTRHLVDVALGLKQI